MIIQQGSAYVRTRLPVQYAVEIHLGVDAIKAILAAFVRLIRVHSLVLLQIEEMVALVLLAKNERAKTLRLGSLLGLLIVVFPRRTHEYAR